MCVVMQGKAGWSNVPMLLQTLVLGNKMTPVRNSIFKKITMILFIALFTAVYPHSRVCYRTLNIFDAYNDFTYFANYNILQ